MQLSAKSIKISASSDASHWGGSFCENGLFILLEAEGNADEPAQKKGKEILDLILTKVTNFKERNLSALQELIKWLKEVKSLQTATLGFLQEDILYVANLGDGEIILHRNGKTGKILSSGESSSGKVFPGDTILFTSKTFMSCIDASKRQEFLASQNLTDVAEEVSTILLDNPHSPGAAAILVGLENQVTTPEPEAFPPAAGKQDYRNIIAEKWQNLISLFRQKQEDLLESPEEAKSKKTLLTIAVILITLLIASIFFNINHSQSTNKQKLLQQTLDLISHQYDEAVSLIDLNPARARTLLSDSKLSLSQIFKEFPKNSKEYKQINDWLNKIAEEEVAAYKIYKFTSVPLFFDISFIKTGGTGNKMSLHQQTAVILDSKNKAVYSLVLDTKKAGIIAGGEVVKNTQTVAVHGSTAYLLNSDGIIQIDILSKTSQVVVKTNKEWGEISDLVAFAGNLYLLDRKNNTIWKYIALDSGLSEKTSYLNPDVKVSFTRERKMVIDGSVWVLADPGIILKFTNGHGDTFAFKGLADTISDISTIFTADEDKYLYVLDKHASRILVLDKDGNYQSQYQWDGLKDADDIVVSEDQKKIFVLSAGKIYAIDLK